MSSLKHAELRSDFIAHGGNRIFLPMTPGEAIIVRDEQVDLSKHLFLYPVPHAEMDVALRYFIEEEEYLIMCIDKGRAVHRHAADHLAKSMYERTTDSSAELSDFRGHMVELGADQNKIVHVKRVAINIEREFGEVEKIAVSYIVPINSIEADSVYFYADNLQFVRGLIEEEDLSASAGIPETAATRLAELKQKYVLPSSEQDSGFSFRPALASLISMNEAEELVVGRPFELPGKPLRKLAP